MSEALVEARHLSKSFALRGRGLWGRKHQVLAVDDVSFEIAPGETFGLVGESGSGKTTIAKMFLKLEQPTTGSLEIEGKPIFGQSRREEKAYRHTVQAIFQDPYGALSPRMRVDRIIAEPLRAQGMGAAEIAAEIPRLLDLVGLRRDAATSYPHQFSGGQRQRIAIARAVSVNPRFLILDEPVSALDVSIKAQILMLLRDMQEKLGLTYLFIGHDLAIVKFISRQVGVMYFGRMVERGPAEAVLHRPLHPYTKRLVAVASLKQKVGAHRLIGELPNPLNPPGGCQFRMRCPFATEICRAEIPLFRDTGGHHVACHHSAAIEAGDKAETGPIPQ